MSTLFTARLVFDPLVPGDSAELFTVRGDPEVMKFWDWPHDSDPSMTAHLVEQMLREVASAARFGRCGSLRWSVRRAVRLE
jgi:RimJ/RimL family protein N-acetyltransferase